MPIDPRSKKRTFVPKSSSVDTGAGSVVYSKNLRIRSVRVNTDRWDADGITIGNGTDAGVTLKEMSAEPANPAANQALLYCIDNGAGKTVLKVMFSSGAGIVIATQV